MITKVNIAKFAANLASEDPEMRAEALTILNAAEEGASSLLNKAVQYETSNVSTYALIGLTFFFLPGVLFGKIFFDFVGEEISARAASYLVFPCTLVFQMIWLWFITTHCGRFIERLSDKSHLRAIGLELARRDDILGIAPLVRVWSVTGATPGNDHATHELARLFSFPITRCTNVLSKEEQERLRSKVRSLYTRGKGIHPIRPRHDFPDVTADLLAALMRVWAISSDVKDRSLVQRIASGKAITPNQIFVRDAAQICLQAANPQTTQDRASLPTEETYINSSSATDTACIVQVGRGVRE